MHLKWFNIIQTLKKGFLKITSNYVMKFTYLYVSIYIHPYICGVCMCVHRMSMKSDYNFKMKKKTQNKFLMIFIL